MEDVELTGGSSLLLGWAHKVSAVTMAFNGTSTTLSTIAGEQPSPFETDNFYLRVFGDNGTIDDPVADPFEPLMTQPQGLTQVPPLSRLFGTLCGRLILQCQVGDQDTIINPLIRRHSNHWVQRLSQQYSSDPRGIVCDRSFLQVSPPDCCLGLQILRTCRAISVGFSLTGAVEQRVANLPPFTCFRI